MGNQRCKVRVESIESKLSIQSHSEGWDMRSMVSLGGDIEYASLRKRNSEQVVFEITRVLGRLLAMFAAFAGA